MATDTKIKIFIFFVFVVVAIVLFTEVVNLVDSGFSTIKNKKNEINCNNVEIIESNYLNNKLMLEISSPRMNITKLTVITDNNDEKIIEIEPITAGQTKTITIYNITISQKYKIYAEDCLKNTIENEI